MNAYLFQTRGNILEQSEMVGVKIHFLCEITWNDP